MKYGTRHSQGGRLRSAADWRADQRNEAGVRSLHGAVSPVRHYLRFQHAPAVRGLPKT